MIEQRNLFRTAKESMSGRIRKKTTLKTNWYRKMKPKKSLEEKSDQSPINRPTSSSTNSKNQESMQSRSGTSESATTTKEDGEKDLRTAAVLFVENSKDGRLAKNLREGVERLKDILGYRVKVVERAGTA